MVGLDDGTPVGVGVGGATGTKVVGNDVAGTGTAVVGVRVGSKVGDAVGGTLGPSVGVLLGVAVGLNVSPRSCTYHLLGQSQHTTLLGSTRQPHLHLLANEWIHCGCQCGCA